MLVAISWYGKKFYMQHLNITTQSLIYLDRLAWVAEIKLLDQQTAGVSMEKESEHMISPNAYAHGGKILVDQLLQHGVKRVFSVPGESYLNVLDGLYDAPIENIVCRNESGASFMAEAYGKLTGTPGVAFVTRGPGATNASPGIHTAQHDSTPMILFIGQVKSSLLGRGAFQEINYDKFFGSLCKATFLATDLEELQRFTHQAFKIALEGQPGPVVVALPEDTLALQGPLQPLLPKTTSKPQQIGVQANTDKQFEEWLGSGRRPLIVVGGSLWSQAASSSVAEISHKYHIPVLTAFRRQHHFNNYHPNYVGALGMGFNHELQKMFTECDRLVLLGTRLGDISSNGYTLINTNDPRPKMCWIYPKDLGPNFFWPLDLQIICNPVHFIDHLSRMDLNIKPFDQHWLTTAKNSYNAWIKPTPIHGDLQLPELFQWLSDNLPKDTIVCNGAGNYTGYLHRFFQMAEYPTQVAPTSGSMGYGLPAAISAKLEHPERIVLCVAGDGCLQMTLSEIATASQYNAKIIVIVVNNGMYGTIRMHQERRFPHRVSGTDLINPDFVSMVKSCGWHGESVTQTKGFVESFTRCLESNRPSLIELKLHPEAITPDQTISGLRNSN